VSDPNPDWGDGPAWAFGEILEWVLKTIGLAAALWVVAALVKRVVL